MGPLDWVAHHRLLALAMGATTLIVLVAVAVWYFLLRSPATQVDLGQALHFYRQEQKRGQAESSRNLPPTGVYRYRTTGGEQLSFAGISRSFPTSTNLIVTETARCATLNWEPITQHTEGWVECLQQGGGLSITSSPSYEQIAGTQNSTVIYCPAGTYFVPPHPSIGEKWHTTCRSPGEKIAFDGTVLANSSFTVGTRTVPALHTHITLAFSGSESGTNPSDFWVSALNGLILREQETADFSQQTGPLGSVRYTEQMTIALASMIPVR